MTEEVFSLLADLVGRGLIRVLDLIFVRKASTGQLADLTWKTLSATAGSTHPNSREHRPHCSAKTTSRRPRKCSSPPARRGSWYTSTSSAGTVCGGGPSLGGRLDASGGFGPGSARRAGHRLGQQARPAQGPRRTEGSKRAQRSRVRESRRSRSSIPDLN